MSTFMNRRKILLKRVNRGYNRGVLDVIPPKRKNRRTSKQRTNKTGSQNDGRVVELSWQLPARLRRPIKEDLERERRKRRQREAIVKFERHPLGTQLPTEKVAVAKTRTATGVEQHTADVYRQTSPKLKVIMPPYGGGFVRRGGASAMMSRKTARKQVGSNVAGDVQRRMVVKPVKRRQRKAEEVVVPEKVVSIAGERDVPFDWKSLIGEEKKKETDAVSVEPSRRRFSLPLHFSVWPFSESHQVVAAGESKKKVRRRKLIM